MKKLPLMTALLVFALTGAAVAAEKTAPAVPEQTVEAKASNMDKKKRPKFAECDADKDGFLNRDEYAACHPRKAAKFAEMDADKDGKLSKEEIQVWRDTRKKEKEAVKFTEMDADKDGKLSKEEIQVWRDAHKQEKKAHKQEKKARKDSGV